MEVGDPWQLLTISNNKLTHRQPHHAGRRWGAPAMLTYNLIYWGHLWVHDFGCLLILPKSHSISLQSWLKFHPLETSCSKNAICVCVCVCVCARALTCTHVCVCTCAHMCMYASVVSNSL